MTATAHALVAGAIASKFPDPLTASSLAFTSHFIMDAIPHWDMGTHWRLRGKFTTGVLAIGETILGITVAYLVFGGKVGLPLLAIAVFLSLLPDWLETPWYIFFASATHNKPKKNASFWERLTYRVYKLENVFHAKANFPFGLLTQIITVVFFFALLK